VYMVNLIRNRHTYNYALPWLGRVPVETQVPKKHKVQLAIQIRLAVNVTVNTRVFFGTK